MSDEWEGMNDNPPRVNPRAIEWMREQGIPMDEDGWPLPGCAVGPVHECSLCGGVAECALPCDMAMHVGGKSLSARVVICGECHKLQHLDINEWRRRVREFVAREGARA